MPQLDSLRFFAVFLVMMEHWIPQKFFPVDSLFLGNSGVTFFFVLSGFLITKILLRNKIDAQETGSRRRSLLKNFYIRRSLRIFPIYYLCIGIFLLLPFHFTDPIKNNATFYLLYLNNILFYIQQDWQLLGHTWTLAVEEQFYLIWPWVILLIPSRHLLKVLIGFILLGFASYYSLYFLSVTLGHTDLSEGYYTVLTPARFDAFALGGIVAWVQVYKAKYGSKLNDLAGPFLLLFLAVWSYLLYLQNGDVFFYSMKFFVVAISTFVVIKASIGFNGIGGKILEMPVLIYLGKISYGLYLFHFIISTFYERWEGSILPEISQAGIRFIIYFALTVLISSLSWHFFERPVNRLKRHFEYSNVSTPKR